MKRLTAIAILIAASGTSVPHAAPPRLARPDKTRQSFQRDGAGAYTVWDAQWSIVPGPGGRIGLIVAAAVCGDEAFLLDRQLAAVHRADLRRGAIVADVAAADGPSAFSEVVGLTADCARGALYVVDRGGVAVVDVRADRVVRRFQKPDAFVNGVGTPVLDASAGTLAVPGLWPLAPNDWLLKPIDRMYEGDRIGYRLDLRTGATQPLVAAVEPGCWSLGPNCLFATLDATPGGGWVAAHQVGAYVGVYDRALALVRRIDVRSQLFLERGDRNGSQALDQMIAWNEENSVIRNVYVFGERIVTVHSANRTRGWRPGKAIDFDAFANLHTLTGAGVASDLRLPDVPVGRDATSLYVVDYGSGGRRPVRTEAIALLRVPVPGR